MQMILSPLPEPRPSLTMADWACRALLGIIGIRNWYLVQFRPVIVPRETLGIAPLKVTRKLTSLLMGRGLRLIDDVKDVEEGMVKCAGHNDLHIVSLFLAIACGAVRLTIRLTSKLLKKPFGPAPSTFMNSFGAFLWLDYRLIDW